MRKILLFVIILILISGFAILLFRNKKTNAPEQENLPTTISFMGKVQSIEKDLLVVKQLPTPVNSDTPVYNVRITKNTIFVPPAANEAKTQFSLQDLKTGQIVSITIKENSSFLNKQYEVVNISASPTMNFLSGKILEISDNAITIETIQSAPPAALSDQQNVIPTSVPQKYIVTVNNDTEMSDLSLSDFKKDMTVNVFTAEDITSGQNLTAVRIEPIQSSNLPPAAQPATENPSSTQSAE